MQDMHTMGVGDKALQYMDQLVQLAHMPQDEYVVWAERMAIVQQIYEDRVAKRPQLPWDDDWFRRCEYSVDWKSGEWTVIDGAHS